MEQQPDLLTLSQALPTGPCCFLLTQRLPQLPYGEGDIKGPLVWTQKRVCHTPRSPTCSRPNPGAEDTVPLPDATRLLPFVT